MKKSVFFYFCLTTVLWGYSGYTQTYSPKRSTELFHELQQLNFLGNVLYVAAHPDDENTRLISYLSNQTHANTAYLSLTRGDGGQNLIGTEIRELLGVLRTQELLAARNIDGGTQFFTRANDFGFSKHPEETLTIWNKDTVLSDIVKRIRAFRPDVIINRFNHRTPGTTHGHHTTSAMLSMEAFDLASNPNAYPEQLNKLSPWQAKRIFFNTSWWFYGSQKKFNAAPKKGFITLDVGIYYPTLGQSNNAIAALASSQHLCQGFGRIISRGTEKEYLEFLKGSPTTQQDIFEGINTSWTRIPEGKEISALLGPITENFNFKNPGVHLPTLLKAYSLIKEIKDPFWRAQKTSQIKTLIKSVVGLHLAFQSNTSFATPRERINTTLTVLARNAKGIALKNVTINGAIGSYKEGVMATKPNTPLAINLPLEISKSTPFSNPYWLNETPCLGMYKVANPALIGLPESPASVSVTAVLEINNIEIPFQLPLVYRYAKPDQGELWETFKVLPAVSISLDQEVVLFPAAQPKTVQLTLEALTNLTTGTIGLSLPSTWKATPVTQEIPPTEKGKRQTFSFTITPPKGASEISVKAYAIIDNKTYHHKINTIDYTHIPTQKVLSKSQSKFVRLNLKKQGSHIGYIMGAGDKIPESLEAIGYQVHLLNPNTLQPETLNKYKAVIIGIRALNVSKTLPLKKKELLEYVAQGGVLISQYNTANRNAKNTVSIAPYALTISRDRVTQENAKVTLLAPEHPILNFPNSITQKDFEGWVQERGLYFPNQWDPKFTPLLEMNDQGETPKQGSLLVAPYGRGHFIYTGLSFFRELPAGVPGAYRLLSNMISIRPTPNENKEPLKN